jgi:hypothetical protein
MAISPARPLILVYTVLAALFFLVALLPGNPDVAELGPLGLGVAFQAVVVWGLWGRSGIAWTLAVVSSATFAALPVLVGGPPWSTTLVVTAFLSAVQAGILLTPPVVAYAFGRDRSLASH